jgi:FtsH-binding integral membrane protein
MVNPDEQKLLDVDPYANVAVVDNDVTEKDEERLDQMAFLRKVLGIVGGQLVFTLAIAIWASYDYNFGYFVTSLGC